MSKPEGRERDQGPRAADDGPGRVKGGRDWRARARAARTSCLVLCAEPTSSPPQEASEG